MDNSFQPLPSVDAAWDFDAFDDEFEASVDPALLNWDFEGFDDLPMIHLLSMDE